MRPSLLLRYLAAPLAVLLALSAPLAVGAEPAPAPPGAQEERATPAPPPEEGQAAQAQPGSEQPPPGDAPPTLKPGEPAPLVEPVPPPVVPVPELEKQPPRPDDVFSGRPIPSTEEDRAREHSWFDASRTWVGQLFFSPVVKLDRFFSDETDLDPERSRSFARLRGGLRLRQDGKPAFSGDVLAQLYLPGVDKWLDRFRLVLSGASDTTDQTFTTDDRAGAPLPNRRDPTNIELRFGAYRGIRSSIDLGAGVLFRIPPGGIARIRYRLAVPIDESMLLRFSPQVFWRTDMLFGARVTSALEWPVSPSSMLRLAGSSQVAQRKTNGIDYGASLGYSYAFAPRAAVALGTDAVGATRSEVAFSKYRVFVRFRHDVLRRWLFIEAEPEIGWPWTEERGRYRAFAVMLRLEMQFEGNAAAVN